MNKTKKIILSIVCIISAIVISSVPAFAEDTIVTRSLWLQHQGRTPLDKPTVFRMYSMGADANKNRYYHFLENNKILPDISFPSSATGYSDNVRIGFVLYANDLVPYIPGTQVSFWERNSNTLFNFPMGSVVDIQFDLHVGMTGNSSYPELLGDITLNGYRSQEVIQYLTDDAFNTLTLKEIIDSNYVDYWSTLYHSSIEYLRKGSSPSIGQVYHVRFIAPATPNTFLFDFSLSIPQVAGSNLQDLSLWFQAKNVEFHCYNSVNDVPNFFYVPNFDGSFDDVFEDLEDMDDFFDGHLSTALQDYASFKDELSLYLKSDLKNGFAVIGVFFDSIFQIRVIRILFILSVTIGIFAFVINSNVNPFGVRVSKTAKSISKKNKGGDD